jgi:hypothetical protein
MPLSEEQRRLIIKDFMEAFQLRYGEDWIYNLTKSLRPSPIPHIAQKYGVKVSQVRKIRQQFIALGHLVQLQYLLTTPIPTHTTDVLLVPEW